MNYNDGCVHIDFYNREIDLEKIAEQFSEGDLLLKNSLLELWKNGIKTIACCRGHSEKQPAYISLIINDDCNELIHATCEYLYLQDGKIELDFGNKKDYDIFTVYMASEKDKKNYLMYLQNFLSQENKIRESNNNVPIYADYLLKMSRGLGVSLRYTIDKNKMMFGFSRPGTIHIFNENALLLDDLIHSIRETGNLPLISISCNEQSLQQFINIVYPNSFIKQNGIQK